MPAKWGKGKILSHHDAVRTHKIPTHCTLKVHYSLQRKRAPYFQGVGGVSLILASISLSFIIQKIIFDH